MKAYDLMSSLPVTVREDTRVSEIAYLLSEHGVSALPVVGEAGDVVGVVSEADLMHRVEIGTERKPHTWWQTLLAGHGSTVNEFLKAHGTCAADVMSTPAITVAFDAELDDIVGLMDRHGIKRLPVVDDGRIIGLVSRGDILRELASEANAVPSVETVDDRTIEAQIRERIRTAGWTDGTLVNVTVDDGVADVWGQVETAEQRRALWLLIDEVPGVRRVVGHLAGKPRWVGV